MLVLAPAACCLAGVALHEVLAALFRGVHSGGAPDAAAAVTKEEAPVIAPGRAQHRKVPKAKVCARGRCGCTIRNLGFLGAAPSCSSRVRRGKKGAW